MNLCKQRSTINFSYFFLNSLAAFFSEFYCPFQKEKKTTFFYAEYIHIFALITHIHATEDTQKYIWICQNILHKKEPHAYQVVLKIMIQKKKIRNHICLIKIRFIIIIYLNMIFMKISFPDDSVITGFYSIYTFF